MNSIKDLQEFYEAVVIDANTNYKGGIMTFGEERLVEMLLGERVVQLISGEINEEDYINRWIKR